jgi:hypothetical protein
MPMLRSAVSLFVLSAVLACAGQNDPEEPAPERERSTGATLQVVNRSSSDMDIFVVSSSSRIRIGFAPGNQTTRFALNPTQFAGAGTVRFQAAPIRPPGQGVTSEPVSIRPGEEISLDIPPP